MLNKLFNRSNSSYIFPLALLAIAVFLAAKNYSPGTFLTGWDTLHPEFNLGMAFRNVVFGSWRSDQGLGSVPVHSHMAELPRLIFLWLSDLVLPTNFLRYFYFFVTLAIGPLGVYFFLKEAFKRYEKPLIANLASFAGGAYYLLNLGTLQHFYVPFEMFATQFGLLPWIYLFAVRALRYGEKKNLVLLGLVSFLAAPQAYAATLFYAYLLCFVVFLISANLIKRNKPLLKRSLLVLATIFVTNAFWLLPNLYTITNHTDEVTNSKINQLFTQESFLANKNYGQIQDIAIHKNFLFSWREFDYSKGEFVDLLNEWQAHLDSPLVLTLGYLFAGFVLLGVIVSLKGRDAVSAGVLLAALVALFFLINENPPTEAIFTFLKTKLRLVEEGFRMPFTKFSITFMFAAAYFFGQANYAIYNLLKGAKGGSISAIATATTLLGLVIFMWPAFGGNLISPSMRINIPSEYSELFDWFSKEEKGRVATLPLNSFWGWKYHSWGYQGAGFIWFGIDNPVLERDFDRWNADNETFYLSASNAVYDQNQEQFEQTLKKYNVAYLVFDKSIINAGGSDKQLGREQIESLLSSSGTISKVTSIGFIDVYKTNLDHPLVSAPQAVRDISYDSTYQTADFLDYDSTAFVNEKGYLSYPFANVDSREQKTETNENSVILKTETSLPEGSYYINLPDIAAFENYVVADVVGQVDVNNSVTLRFELVIPALKVDGVNIETRPSHYVYIFPATSQKPGFVTIGDQVFDISSLTPGVEVNLGETLVSTTQSTFISVYSNAERSQPNFLSQIKSRQASWCSDENKKVDLKDAINGFSLEVGKESLCIGNGLALPQNGLSKLSFSSVSSIFPYVCIQNTQSTGCINDNLPTFYNTYGIWKENSYLTPLTKGDYWLAFVAQGQIGEQKTVAFQNVNVSYFPLIRSASINFGDMYKMLQSSLSYEVTNPKVIELVIPKKAVTEENFNLRRGHSQAYNCDIGKKGNVEKEWGAGSVEYSAFQNGISCDYFDFPKLNSNLGYYVNVEGENTQGRGLKLYIQNKAQERMSTEVLLPEGEFQSGFYLVPDNGASKGGYVVNVENRSFGRIASQNTLSSLEFIPVPLNLIRGINITRKGESESTQINNVSVSSGEKKGLTYTLKTQSESDEGLIVLWEGFDQGWAAYEKNGLHLQKLTHLEVNSWANGWRVPSGESEIVIIYWPQLLEYIGFISLLVLPVLMLVI